MKVSEFIERELLDMIQNELTAGEKLPSENDLSNKYGVSRASIREAIQSLESKNVVVRRNGGTFVASSAEDVFVVPLNVMIDLKFARPDELSQVRILLETEAFRLAFERMEEDDLKRLEDIVWMMQKPQLELDKFFALDNEFHSLIAEASGNAVLCTFIKDIIKVISSLYVSEEGDEGETPAISDVGQNIHYYKEIVKGLNERDKEKVITSAQKHLRECTGKIVHS